MTQTVNYLVVLLAAAALYIATCAPGPLWQDSGMYQYRIWHNDIEGNLGLALSHPLYLIIGIGAKYIPFGEFAYRVNLISAVAAAFTIANLFLLLRLWLGKNTPAVLAAITLALSWTIWQFATIAEVYTLYTALFLDELVMLLLYVKTKRIGFLYLLALFNGLAIANHMWGIIPFACYVVFVAVLLVQKQIRLKNLAIMVGLWVIGAAPYEYLIIKNIIQTGDFTATLASAFFGKNWSGAVLNTRLSVRLIAENMIFITYNFSTFNGLFFFAGLYGLKKVSPHGSFTNILLAMLILFFLFAFRYTVPDRYAFFTPFYCLVSVLIGIGYNWLVVTQPNRKIIHRIVFIFALMPIPAYIIAPVIAQKVQFNLSTKRNIPYRNEYIWFLRPWKTGYNGAENFANEALEAVEDKAIIYADGTVVYPLLYMQEIYAKRRDVTIVSGYGSINNLNEYEERIGKAAAEGAFYVVSPVAGYCPGFLLKRYKFEQRGVLWRVIHPAPILKNKPPTKS